jgi:fibronectin-binding autotransporter adhesin
MGSVRGTAARRVFTAVACGAAVWVGLSVAAAPALAADLCVGGPGCFATIQAAVDAAQDGDTIEIGPGTFAGGLTILKSVKLAGVAAGATIIEGGGPVITIGEFLAPTQPTVAISRVTITGGLNDSSPGPAVAAGGGMKIESGATVTIADSVITGNKAAPKATFDGPAPCGSVPFDQCAFASGGGIDNSGALTLSRTRVADNQAGPGVASSIFGGGISNHPQGTLTLRQSVVTGNRAVATPPNGRSADGGGISGYGVLTVEDSVISNNSSEVAASVPSVFLVDFAEANGGGLYLPQGSTTTITGSRISGNSVRGSNTAGDIAAEAGGIDSDGSLLLTGSSVENNAARAIVPASSGFLAESDGGGIQIQGSTIVRDSRIANNSLSSTSETGTALSSGGGLFNISGSLTLERTIVTGNSASAAGVGGFNLGGGIVNVTIGGPAPELTLTDSVIAANRVAASAGIVSQGGGLYTADPFSGTPFPVTLTRTVIEGNKPDQCVGC